ncbi:hypothetical protein SELR_pSRC400190 (plasmid) [Selenomonas ruminantium subsp. lactilytica TAM6421]|uniref:Uncharacterized protein n=1 Tax=Selenomonas ruminantium subsp. lactilytica (strain NBRC 103574 / TAM6421) TaxID=927704 RepID=I0GV83_SELRL|nr:hypothetical protein SELR_pSRC400190 [Selenomonas ruminantium subsp. lactilytica TAM6421]
MTVSPIWIEKNKNMAKMHEPIKGGEACSVVSNRFVKNCPVYLLL